MKPFCVGLTGGIGSGKSLVANEFARLGAGIVDTDAIARQLTAEQGAAMPYIAVHFGARFLTASGALERSAMSDLIFADAQARQRLESILHPMIRDEAQRQLWALPTRYAVLVVPLLVEHLEQYRSLVDRILVVDCDVALQLQRVLCRVGMTAGRAQSIIASQTDRTRRLACADDVIHNNSDVSSVESQVQQLHTRYLELAGPSQ